MMMMLETTNKQLGDLYNLSWGRSLFYGDLVTIGMPLKAEMLSSKQMKFTDTNGNSFTTSVLKKEPEYTKKIMRMIVNQEFVTVECSCMVIYTKYSTYTFLLNNDYKEFMVKTAMC